MQRPLILSSILACIVVTVGSPGQAAPALPAICLAQESTAPDTRSLGALWTRLVHELHRMSCAEKRVLQEPTLDRRRPYEDARQRASGAVWETIGQLEISATAEEASLLGAFKRAFWKFSTLSAEAASIGLLAETPAETAEAQALSSGKGQAAFDAVRTALNQVIAHVTPQDIDVAPGNRQVERRGPTPRGELRIVDKRTYSSWAVLQSTFESLVEIDRDGRPVPRLATGWRWLDARTLDVTLRQGVTFQNGEVFDAEIVALNATMRYGLWPQSPRVDLTVVDPYRLRLRFPQPVPEALVLVTVATIPMLNRAFYQTMQRRESGATAYRGRRVAAYFHTLFLGGPWGTGPYRMVDGSFLPCIPSTGHVVLEANPGYWDPTRYPRVQRVVFDRSLTGHTAMDLVKNGEGRVDLVVDMRPLNTLRVAQSRFSKVVKERHGLRNILGLLNMRKDESPWRDVRLRRAVNMAINRAHVIRYAAKGNGVPIPALLPPGAFGFDATLAPYPFDPTHTRQLLREAGHPEGLSLTLIATSELAVQATVVSKMLEQAGFTVQRRLLDACIFVQETELPLQFSFPADQWDIALVPTDSVSASTTLFPTRMYDGYALGGLWDWVDEQPELRDVFTQLHRTSDRKQQQVLIHRLERHTHDQAYFLFLYNIVQLYAVNKEVTFVPHPSGFFYLADTSVTDQHWSVRKQKAVVQE